MQAYFDRRLTRFDLPLDMGQGFQGRVRQAMAAIPYGETRTYGALARDLGAPAQAVGQACGAIRCPSLCLVIVCWGKRVLAAFPPRGVESKVALLRLEGAAGLLI
ncbi:methylated-DNA--[protein]-cysteine S-methyltransferase [Gemmobacter lanyuensis]